MTITCVEQSRQTIQLATLPYTVTAPFGVLNYHNANNFAYACDGPVLQYGCSETGTIANPVSIPSMTVQFLGQTAAVETDYGTAPGADTQIDTNVIFWDCRAAWSTTGLITGVENAFYYDVAFDAGVAQSAISYVHSVVGSAANPTGTGASPFLWTGLTKPFLVAVSFDHVAGGNVEGFLYDGSSVTTAATILTIPAPSGHNFFEPDLIKPDAANNQNLFLSRQSADQFVPSMLSWVAGTDSTTGANNFADTLTYSAPDVVRNLITNALNISWMVRPDGWYAWNLAGGGWGTDGSGNPLPADVGCVLVRISNDFTKYWVYYFTWLPGDATAQNIIENADIQQILLDGTYVYYQELDFPGTVLSAVFTIPAGAPALIAPPSDCSPTPPPPVHNVQMSVGDLYFTSLGFFEDFSATVNRRRFISPSGGDLYLGPNGEGAFGALPAVFLTVTGGGAPNTADTFAQNNGGGGTFAEINGPLVLSVSSPPGSTSSAPSGQNVVGDYRNGQIYTFDLDNPFDAGVMRRWLRSFRATPQPSKQPRRFDCLTIDMETGNQVPQVGEGAPPLGPLVVLRYSDDGGHTWSNEIFRMAGPPGAEAQRVMFKRLGATRRGQGLDRIFEISSSDSFKVAIIGAEIDP